jgi:transposase
MSAASSPVPAEELAALRAQVETLQKQLRDREREEDLKTRQIHELEATLKIETLARERAEAKLQDLLRRMYGPKSEQLSPDQLRLLLEPLEADEQLRQETPPVAVVVAKDKPVRKGGGRRPAPAHLPIERIEIDLPETEKAGMVRIREEITEEIDYQPSQFIRRHYVRFVYADPKKQAAPKMPSLPPRVIPQAGVGVGLLVHLLVSKYTDHVPLYRQEQIAARVGVELPRQKLCRWVEQAALLLRTIHDRLRERILASGYVQADETPVKVLDPDRGGHAARAYLWTYLSPLSEAIVFDFDLSRSRANLREFFPPGWQGVLQSDGYEAYESFLKDKPRIVHAGCMAHLRRYVVEALEAGAHLDIVAQLLSDIALLYRIETEAKKRALSHGARAELRQRESLPILERLHEQFKLIARSELPQSRLGKAAAYALARWETLARYADPGMGHVLIDQNSVERGIRPTKLGAKNWLYIGHPDAGWRSAVIYSITGSCKLLKINPVDYLTWVLPRLAAATSGQIDGLLPHDYAAALAAA